jgi:hypothetical protein
MDYFDGTPGSTYEHVWRLTWNYANMSQESCYVIRIESDDLGNDVRDIYMDSATFIRLVSISHKLLFTVCLLVMTSQWMLRVKGIGTDNVL